MGEPSCLRRSLPLVSIGVSEWRASQREGSSRGKSGVHVRELSRREVGRVGRGRRRRVDTNGGGGAAPHAARGVRAGTGQVGEPRVASLVRSPSVPSPSTAVRARLKLSSD